MDTNDSLALQPRILVVDDEASARHALRKLLHAEGFAVECASDGRAALDRLSAFDPDVVLTDLQLPGLDGIQLCTRLRERDPMLPVILMTAHDDAQSILRGLRAGVDDYLTKPLDIELLLSSLRRAIAVHAGRIEQQHARARTEALLAEARSAANRHEEVLAVVAHDLRSPLSVIQIATELLLGQGTELTGAARRLVESITRSLASSNQILANLLDEARLQGSGITLEPRFHPVDDLLADVRDLRPLALRRGIVLDVRPAPDGTLSCDRAKMGQVLSNLVGNAIKFSPRGGTVTVSAERTAGCIRLAVRDQGPGISSGAQTHLFERYWQDATGRAEGVGLGLYIAKGIVEAHGGHIQVQSEVGDGSTFLVTLPVERPVATVDGASRPRARTPSPFGLHAPGYDGRRAPAPNESASDVQCAGAPARAAR